MGRQLQWTKGTSHPGQDSWFLVLLRYWRERLLVFLQFQQLFAVFYGIPISNFKLKFFKISI